MHHVPRRAKTTGTRHIVGYPERCHVGVKRRGSARRDRPHSVNGLPEYVPPCCQGPGERLYTLMVYALSGRPDLPNPTVVDRDTLLAAIDDMVLDQAVLDVIYTRDDEGNRS